MAKRAIIRDGWTVLDPQGKPACWAVGREAAKDLAVEQIGWRWGTLVAEGYRLVAGKFPTA